MRIHLRMLQFLTCSFLLAACGAPTEADLADELADDGADGKADSAGTLSLTPLSFALGARADAGGFGIMTSNADFRNWFGVSSTGVDWSRDWVVYYSPGSSRRGSTPRVTVRRSSDLRVISAVSRIESPGTGCLFVSIPGGATPYVLAKFRPGRYSGPYQRSIEYSHDETTFSCEAQPVDLTCANSGCAPGFLCRLVDGNGVCVTVPAMCDFVECPAGTVCGYDNGKASCLRAPFNINDGSGPDVTFPPEDNGLVVTFPTGQPPSSCRKVVCGAGSICQPSLRTGRGQCVQITNPNPWN